MHVDREKFPEGLAPKEFLPELPEERARRERKRKRRKAPVNPEQYASFKERWAGLTKRF
jgi:hypothetical protein